MLFSADLSGGRRFVAFTSKNLEDLDDEGFHADPNAFVAGQSYTGARER